MDFQKKKKNKQTKETPLSSKNSKYKTKQIVYTNIHRTNLKHPVRFIQSYSTKLNSLNVQFTLYHCTMESFEEQKQRIHCMPVLV